jgi:hypothetical protein
MGTLSDLREYPTAATHLYQEYAEGIAAALGRRFPRMDPGTLYDAAVDAILDIAGKLDRVERPDELDRLLFVAALNKCRDRFRSDGSRSRREQIAGDAFVARQAAAPSIEENAEAATLVQRVFDEIATTPQERIMLEHWGEDFESVAAALGWQDRPRADQRRDVKRLRDRLDKRLRRLEEEGHDA